MSELDLRTTIPQYSRWPESAMIQRFNTGNTEHRLWDPSNLSITRCRYAGTRRTVQLPCRKKRKNLARVTHWAIEAAMLCSCSRCYLVTHNSINWRFVAASDTKCMGELAEEQNPIAWGKWRKNGDNDRKDYKRVTHTASVLWHLCDRTSRRWKEKNGLCQALSPLSISICFELNRTELNLVNLPELNWTELNWK